MVTNYTYNDPENKLTNVSYDGFGRLATADNGVTQTDYGYTTGGTTAPGYDNDDNPLNVQTGYDQSGSIAFSKNIDYRYYPDGSKSSMVTPAGTFSYSYDGKGRMIRMSDPGADTFAWIYLSNDWISSQVSGNSGGQTVCEASYQYNAIGEITDILNANGSGDRLSEYDYDGVGNRVSVSADIPSNTTFSGSTSYVYNNQNELTLESSNTGSAFTNMLSYDVENRMTAFGTSYSADYDFNGLRSWKSEGAQTTYYLYDDLDEPTVEFALDGSVESYNNFGANGPIGSDPPNPTRFPTCRGRWSHSL